MRKLSAVLLAGAFVAVSGIKAMADTFGVVDMEQIYRDYGKAESIRADVKVKEAELRKMQADFVKQLEESKKSQPNNPVANTQLEKELEDKLNAKLNEYRDWMTTQQKTLDDTVKLTIGDVAKTKGVTSIFYKQAMFQGGVDITNEVLAKLNK